MELLAPSFLRDVNSGKIADRVSFSGVVLISSYSLAVTKNGKEYISGTILSEVKVPFKVWGNATAFSKLKNEEYSNTPTLISGTVDNYGGTGSLIIDDVVAVSGFTADQFLEQKYNIDAYYDATFTLLKKNVSEKAMNIVNTVFGDDELVRMFKIEFAATSHHDNCKGGLLAHTYKCLSLLNWTLSVYDGVYEKSQDRKDLLFLGMLFHDIGKVREMNLGVYQSCSRVTHRYLGIEFLSPLKDSIIEAYNEDWYYDLISIFLQHHGEYGDPCKTLASYIINKVDLYESQLAYAQQLLSENTVEGSSGKRVSIDGTWLSV